MKNTPLLLLILIFSLFIVPTTYAASGDDGDLKISDSYGKDKAAAEAKAKLEAEAKAKAESEAKAKAESEAKAKAYETTAKAKEAAELRAKAESEAKAKVAAEAAQQAAEQAAADAVAYEKAKAESAKPDSEIGVPPDPKLNPPKPDNKEDESDGEASKNNNDDNQVVSDDSRDDPGEGKQVSDGESSKKETSSESFSLNFEEIKVTLTEQSTNNKTGDVSALGSWTVDCNLFKDTPESKLNSEQKAACGEHLEAVKEKCSEGDRRTLDGADFKCQQGEWLGPLGGDGVFKDSNSIDTLPPSDQDKRPIWQDEGELVIGDNYFKDDELELGIRGPISKEISNEEKAFIKALGNEGIYTSTTNGKLYREIQSSGCKNTTIRKIDNDTYVCEGNLWLGPLGGDGVFKDGNSPDEKSGVIIGDNHFKKLTEEEIATIKESAVSEWQAIAKEVANMSQEELEEMQVELEKAGAQALRSDGEYISENPRYKSDANELDSRNLEQAARMMSVARQAAEEARQQNNKVRAGILEQYEREIRVILDEYNAERDHYQWLFDTEAMGEVSIHRRDFEWRTRAQLDLFEQAKHAIVQGGLRWSSRFYTAKQAEISEANDLYQRQLTDAQLERTRAYQLMVVHNENQARAINQIYVTEIIRIQNLLEESLRHIELRYERILRERWEFSEELYRLAEQQYYESTAPARAIYENAVAGPLSDLNNALSRLELVRDRQLRSAQTTRDEALAALEEN